MGMSKLAVLTQKSQAPDDAASASASRASGGTSAGSPGPVVAVFPDDVIYGGVIPDDVPAIMDHLHDAGLHTRRASVRGDVGDPAHVPAEIEHDRLADGLARQ